MKNNYFETDNLSFTAALLLEGNYKVVAVPHRMPQFIGHKAFRITPGEKAKIRFEAYQLDEILVSPRLLSLTIKKVKNLPINKTSSYITEQTIKPWK